MVTAEVSDIERSKFFVAIKVNQEVSGVSDEASRGKLSVSYH